MGLVSSIKLIRYGKMSLGGFFMLFSFMGCYLQALFIDQKRCPSPCAPEGLTQWALRCAVAGMLVVGGVLWHCFTNTQRSGAGGCVNVKQSHYIFCCV